MLTRQTLDKLRALKLHGMVKAFEEQSTSSDWKNFNFEERLKFMADREITDREGRRVKTLLKQAKLRQQASIDDINCNNNRGFNNSLLESLASCQWIKDHNNVLITGPTGAGKTFIACALGHSACLGGFKVLYYRAPRLFHELAVARGDGRYSKLMNSIAKIHLLVIDDWGFSTLTDQERSDFLEILEDRDGLKSTIIATQLPIEFWYDTIGNPTIADAILDRLIHNAYTINLRGESMRKEISKLTYPQNNNFEQDEEIGRASCRERV